MFVSIMAFFAQVSDPAVGGTYMTLLNTITNLGGKVNIYVDRLLYIHYMLCTLYLDRYMTKP